MASLFRLMYIPVAIVLSAACGTETGPEQFLKLQPTPFNGQKSPQEFVATVDLQGSSVLLNEHGSLPSPLQNDPQLWGQQAKLTASDGMGNPFFCEFRSIVITRFTPS